MIRFFFFFLLFFYVHFGHSQIPIEYNYPKETFPGQLSKSRHAYHQTLTMKLFMSQAMFDGKWKRRDNGESEVYLNCEQALEAIRKIDKLSLGIPKIIYLVGWQYNGHDSQYPAFFQGNERLKRPQDASMLESIRWLMKEAKKYNTLVSLHINMFDAYEDSPLWDTYAKNNIIARHKDGSFRGGEWGYPISYAQEWKTGYAQQRIDSLCSLLPITEAGTIHIDAFHSWPPIPVLKSDGSSEIRTERDVISPYLSFTVEDEIEAQRNIFQYWNSKGVDVTSEGVDFLRGSNFEGFQFMAWWFSDPIYYLRWPASYYCGGEDRGEWGKLFGASMHGEDILKKDPVKLSGFKEQFALKTLIWYYLNRLERKSYIDQADYKAVLFSENVQTELNKGKYTLKQGSSYLAHNNNVLVPALWLKYPALVAYSKDGYKNLEWNIPAYQTHNIWDLYKVETDGYSKITTLRLQAGNLQLTLQKDQLLLLVPAGQALEMEN